MVHNAIVDIHSHILYGIDDGSKDLEESIQMLKLAYKQGIQKVIATPHSYSKVSIDTIKSTFQTLQKEIDKILPDMQLYLGQEILYFHDCPDYLKSGELLTLHHSKYVLVEFSPNISFMNLYISVRNLSSHSFIPIIAHIERYIHIQEESNLEKLINMGALLQMNYTSLIGNIFSREVHWCRDMVKKGYIHYLATDMHGIHYRKPEITKALKWLYKSVDKETIQELLFSNSTPFL